MGRQAAAGLGDRLSRRVGSRCGCPAPRPRSTRPWRRSAAWRFPATTRRRILAQRPRADAAVLSSRRQRRARRCGVCRSSRRRRTRDLGGEQLIEWGGALRWLARERAHRRRARSRLGARARRPRDALSRRRQERRARSSRCGGRDAGAAPAAQGDVRSRGHPQPRPPVSGFLTATCRPRSPISSATRPTAARPTRSCARACIAASARRPARRTSCSATSSTVRAGASTSSSRCSKAARSTAKTQLHLDRCLTCRSCETTCPSGVKYGRLLDIGRHVVDEQVGAIGAARAPSAGASCAALLSAPAVRRGARGGPAAEAAAAGGRCAPRIPDRAGAGRWPAARHPRRMLVLDGLRARRARADRSTPRWRACSTASAFRSSASRGGGCCGALPHHLNERGARARDRQAQHRRLVAARRARRRGDRRHRERLRRDGEGLRPPAAPRSRATRRRRSGSRSSRATPSRSSRGMDADRAARSRWTSARSKVAFHSPCTLQHGMKLEGPRRGDPARARPRAHAGRRRAPVLRLGRHVFDPAAGAFGRASKANKLAALEAGKPDVIATANIGCLTHLAERRARSRCGTGSSFSTRGWSAAARRR